MTAMILNDIQCALQETAKVRLALNILQNEIPPGWSDSACEALRAMREQLQELELREIRQLGPQEYLLIKPLAPDAGGPFAEKAAEHIRALDDLGLVVRLDL